MRKTLIIFCIISLISSCKKDKLEGDKEVLVGKWKWVYSDLTLGVCNPPEYNTQINPTSENINYSIEFLKCGKVIYYKNNEKIEKDRIVFNTFKTTTNSSLTSEYYEFGILGDNDLNKAFSGFVKSDTLIIGGYYFFFDENRNCNGCCYYLNYFIRE